MDVASGGARFPENMFTGVEIALGSLKVNPRVCAAYPGSATVSFALTQVLFCLNPPQAFRVGVEGSARNCKVSLQSGRVGLGLLPATTAKNSRPETSGAVGLTIH